MRRIVLLCCAGLVLGCSKGEEQPAADTTAMGAPTLMLSDVAGTWQIRVMGEMSDSVLTEYQMTATADPTTWVVTLPNRPPMTPTVTVSGDSIVMDMGPFESVLRAGVQVTTHSVARLQGGELVGTTTARYASASGDSVVTLRTRGTRAP
jgi:hypothetical protein